MPSINATITYEVPKTCPQCPKIANTFEEIDEKFGFRTMENETIIPQSWCRECRKEGLKK